MSEHAASPLVCLHGVSSGPACWNRWLPYLAPTLPRTPDLARPAGGGRWTSLASAAGGLAGEIAAAGTGPVTLLGHSMGGLVALLLALEHPGMVRSLVLVDTPALPLPGGPLGRLGAVMRSTGHTDPTTFPMLARGLLRMGPLRLTSALREIVSCDLADRLPELHVPTLLVWGADDVVVPAEIGARMAELLPDARLVLVPGAGHMPMWEAPASFAAAIGPFLAEASHAPREIPRLVNGRAS